jgi:hypothetical protein
LVLTIVGFLPVVRTDAPEASYFADRMLGEAFADRRGAPSEVVLGVSGMRLGRDAR